MCSRPLGVLIHVCTIRGTHRIDSVDSPHQCLPEGISPHYTIYRFNTRIKQRTGQQGVATACDDNLPKRWKKLQ
jgi:hypothetical protein